MVSRNRESQIRVASGINALLGLFLIASHWLYGATHLHHNITLSNIVTGTLIAVCGTLRMYRPHRAAFLSVANIAFGFWTLLAPAVFGYSLDNRRLWLNITIGVAAMVFGMWSVSAKLDEQSSP